MRSDSVYEASNIIKVSILNGEIEVETFYCNLINAMLSFFDKLVILSREIGKIVNLGCPISKQQIEKFYDLNRKCDDYEDRRVKTKLNHLALESVSVTTANDINIEKDNKLERGCCVADCNIF
jgi:hypothetical protein